MHRLIKLLRKCYNNRHLTKRQVIELINDLQSFSKENFIKHVLLYYHYDDLLIEYAIDLVIGINNITYTDMKKLSWYNWGECIDVFISDNKYITIKWG